MVRRTVQFVPLRVLPVLGQPAGRTPQAGAATDRQAGILETDDAEATIDKTTIDKTTVSEAVIAKTTVGEPTNGKVHH
jgi:hypothetical protein